MTTNNVSKKNEIKSINYMECLRYGFVGAFGAIPATLLAHPFDAVKIRVQTTGIKVQHAIPLVYANGIYKGVFSGIQQKFFTRGPMFLFSSIGTNVCEKYIGMDRTTATFIGSAISGYCTGFLAAPFEWMKVLRQREQRDLKYSKMILLKQNFAGVIKRLHAGGIRNGMFDSIFFGVQHVMFKYKKELEDEYERTGVYVHSYFVLPGFIYASSAITAATLDYIIDVGVKRMMNKPVTQPTRGLFKLCYDAIKTEGVVSLYRGIGIKTIEIGISYFVTGYCSIHIMRYFDNLLG